MIEVSRYRQVHRESGGLIDYEVSQQAEGLVYFVNLERGGFTSIHWLEQMYEQPMDMCSVLEVLLFQKNIRSATLMLVFVTCTYLASNMLNVIVYTWELIDKSDVIGIEDDPVVRPEFRFR
nr:unnamed protein product [Haemonchus contortus]